MSPERPVERGRTGTRRDRTPFQIRGITETEMQPAHLTWPGPPDKIKSIPEMFTSPQQRQARKLMKKAVAQAFSGMRKNHGGPFGAVVARNGEVISKAHNMVIKTHDPTAHAEIVALRRAAALLKKFDLSDCEIFSTCEPCPMCLAAIYWAKIRRVHYGCTRKDAEKIGFRDRRLYDLIKKRKSPAVEKIKLERGECLKPFQEWNRKKDRVMY